MSKDDLDALKRFNMKEKNIDVIDRKHWEFTYTVEDEYPSLNLDYIQKQIDLGFYDHLLPKTASYQHWKVIGSLYRSDDRTVTVELESELVPEDPIWYCDDNDKMTVKFPGEPIETFDLPRTPPEGETISPTGFKKWDAKKPRMSLIPPKVLLKVAEVLTYGATKYGEDNWRKCKTPIRYYDAAQRHLNAWLDLEKKDSESGLDHLAHAVTCVLFLLELDHEPSREPSKEPPEGGKQ